MMFVSTETDRSVPLELYRSLSKAGLQILCSAVFASFLVWLASLCLEVLSSDPEVMCASVVEALGSEAHPEGDQPMQ